MKIFRAILLVLAVFFVAYLFDDKKTELTKFDGIIYALASVGLVGIITFLWCLLLAPSRIHADQEKIIGNLNTQLESKNDRRKNAIINGANKIYKVGDIIDLPSLARIWASSAGGSEYQVFCQDLWKLFWTGQFEEDGISYLQSDIGAPITNVDALEKHAPHLNTKDMAKLRMIEWHPSGIAILFELYLSKVNFIKWLSNSAYPLPDSW